jgi:hypothetical protein
LEVLVLAERRRLQDDLFEQLDEFNGEICRAECLDGYGNIIGVCALWNCGGYDLSKAEIKSHST